MGAYSDVLSGYWQVGLKTVSQRFCEAPVFHKNILNPFCVQRYEKLKSVVEIFLDFYAQPYGSASPVESRLFRLYASYSS